MTTAGYKWQNHPAGRGHPRLVKIEDEKPAPKAKPKKKKEKAE